MQIKEDSVLFHVANRKDELWKNTWTPPAQQLYDHKHNRPGLHSPPHPLKLTGAL